MLPRRVPRPEEAQARRGQERELEQRALAPGRRPAAQPAPEPVLERARSPAAEAAAEAAAVPGPARWAIRKLPRKAVALRSRRDSLMPQVRCLVPGERPAGACQTSPEHHQATRPDSLLQRISRRA